MSQNTGNVFITQDKYKETIEVAKQERAKLNELLTDKEVINK